MHRRTFPRFLLVGIVNTLVGSAIMFALYNAAHFSYWASSVCNYLLTSALSFFLNKYFTFGVRLWSVKMVLMFVLVVAVSYLFAYGLAKPLAQKLFSAWSETIRGNAALVAGMCIFTLLNYFGQRFFVFGTRRR